MSDVLNAIGTGLMVVAFAVGGCSIAFMHTSNVGERHVTNRDQDLEGSDPGIFGMFSWRRHRDELEVVARWSFWAFVLGVALCIGATFL